MFSFKLKISEDSNHLGVSELGFNKDKVFYSGMQKLPLFEKVCFEYLGEL